MMDTIISAHLSSGVRDGDGASAQTARGDPATTRFWNDSTVAGLTARNQEAYRAGSIADQSSNALGPAEAERIASALRDVKNRIRTDATSLHLRVDGDSGSVQAEIVDSATDKVIRKIPSDELLRLAAAIKKGSVASIYDGTA
ncbi:flagellar protein FlaG [Desulfolutivibrio sp.]|uniref:flagellar protein FlaG n=1 Tax=Desulfolutivibrio sp. TaxID=2773296 RepID=UPI002F969958